MLDRHGPLASGDPRPLDFCFGTPVQSTITEKKADNRPGGFE
jgi:hypothetical protein